LEDLVATTSPTGRMERKADDVGPALAQPREHAPPQPAIPHEENLHPDRALPGVKYHKRRVDVRPVAYRQHCGREQLPSRSHRRRGGWGRGPVPPDPWLLRAAYATAVPSRGSIQPARV